MIWKFWFFWRDFLNLGQKEKLFEKEFKSIKDKTKEIEIQVQVKEEQVRTLKNQISKNSEILGDFYAKLASS